MTLAITRAVSRAIATCELTHVEREPIDLGRARAQHAAYVELLRRLGCEVRELAEEPALADSVFVEDTALVFDEVAVLTRPGAASRRPEVDSIGAALEGLRPLVRIDAPATLDGGDVVCIGRAVYVGLSSRSTREGIDALARLIGPHGYRVHGVPMRNCLHLKTAACAVAPDTLLLNPAWADATSIGGPQHRVIEVDPDEPFAANAFALDGTIVHAAAFSKTRARLEASGFEVAPVIASELAKAEGGVTCCSLIL